MAATRHFAVTLKRSAHHWTKDQQETLKALGLTRFGKVVYVEDSPATRGILYKMVHALEVTAHEGDVPEGKGGQRRLHKGKAKAKANASA